jgi:gentisate 1,2-dioxygenase
LISIIVRTSPGGEVAREGNARAGGNMSNQLGTLEELPKEYLRALNDLSVAPLWPFLRAALPFDFPSRQTAPFIWRYKDVRGHLMKSGELTPMEKAERRVLVLCNPGIGIEKLMATPTIYAGLQLILPGETAEPHRHTPSAIRFVIEGDGGFTIVNGEKCPMEKGDLILTPSGTWHEHWHAGKNPVVWLDALDLPVIGSLEVTYVVEGKRQAIANAADRSQTAYRRSGLVPYASLGKKRADYPLIRFPWREVREGLVSLASGSGPKDPVHLAYVNPETGGECLPILGFSAQMLRPGEEVAPPRRSSSAIIHVIEGAGQSEIDGKTIDWSECDTISVPTYARVKHRATGGKPAFIFHVDDAPLHRKIGIYEELPD